MNDEAIAGVAILDADSGVMYWQLAPARHPHVFLKMQQLGARPGEQGFLVGGRDGDRALRFWFVDRKEAKKIAEANGQLNRPTPHEELYSEDLW